MDADKLEQLGLETVVKHAADLDRLEKFTKANATIRDIRYILDRLEGIGPWKPEDITMDVIHELLILHAALSVAYGRLFVEGSAVKLDRASIPDELKVVHDELISLRHKRFAHHDDHHSISTELDFRFDGTTFVVFQRLKMKMPFGLHEETRELVDWVNAHINERAAKQLRHLSKKSGYEWCLAAAPALEA